MYEVRRSAINTLLVTTECALWHFDNTFLFTKQSEIDFGIAYVPYQNVCGFVGSIHVILGTQVCDCLTLET